MSRAPWVYEGVGLGLGAYATLVHRPVTLGAERLHLRPGEVLACAHISDADVPVVARAIYWAGPRMWRDAGALRPAFAVRNDMLDPGFLAGYPPGLPLALRRALFGIDIGPVMRERVQCLPVRFSDKVRLVEALRARPEARLDELPAEHADALRARARRLRRPAPVTGADVLDGRFADLLWAVAGVEDLHGPGWAPMWADHALRSGGELRRVLAWVRDGGALAIFPHGFPSPDGGVGPFDARAGRLLHQLRPTAVLPAGLSFDPLVAGPPRAYLGVGPRQAAPPRSGGEREVLAGMRRATPITAGLLVAAETVAQDRVPAPGPARAALDDLLTRAREEGRPVDPALARPRRRAARLATARRAAGRLGPRSPLLRRAARTLVSALEPVP